MAIKFIINIIAPIFYKLLYMSINALVVGMIIMLIRRFADKNFSPFWKYTLWVLVFVALILPWRPQSNFAVMNDVERVQELSFFEEYKKADNDYYQAERYFASIGIEEVGEGLYNEHLEQLPVIKAKADSLHIKTLIFDNIIPSIWLFGMIIMGLFIVFSGLRLGKKIKASALPFDTERYETTLQNCKQKLGIKRRVKIVLQDYVKTPALFGLFRPQIILPNYAKNLSDEHLEYVILHELSHFKRRDSVVNMLLLTLQTVYWFNPLTWFLFKYIREDMELANDAAVLKGMGNEKHKEYSLSLVAVLAGYDRTALAPRLLCMVDSEKNMERRINMIKLGEFFKRRKWIIAMTGILVISVIATLFLTVGAANRFEIPSLYVIAVDGNSLKEKVIETLHGKYNWDIGMLIPKQHDFDAQPVYSLEYNEKNTITIGKGQPIFLSNEIKEGHFKGKDIKATIYYSDGTPCDTGVDLALPSKNYFFLSLNEAGEFIYEFEITYGRGKVTYGFKVIIEDHLPNSIPGMNDSSTSDKRKPGIRVTIEEYYGGADTALEVIYEDASYKYSLSSIRSDKIMLTFEDGQRISLKDAMLHKKINIEDLILNGLQVWMVPNDNPMGGYFNVPFSLYKFYIDELEFYPSNSFMYTVENNGFNSYFAVDEFLGYLEKTGYKEIADWFRSSNMHWEQDNMIEGIQYLSQSELESIGILVQIGWAYDSHTPVWFSFSDFLAGTITDYSNNKTPQRLSEMDEDELTLCLTDHEIKIPANLETSVIRNVIAELEVNPDRPAPVVGWTELADFYEELRNFVKGYNDMAS